MSKKVSISIASSFLSVLFLASAVSAQYKVGDRVQIGDEYGTVIEIGAPIYSGGNNIKVHLDKLGAAFPNVGVTYDPIRSKVKPAGAGAPAAPGQAPAGQPGGPGKMPGGQGTAMPAGQAAMPGAGAVNNAIEAAKRFARGQRVFVGNMNEWGTVVGPGIGPNVVRVHLDRFGTSSSTVDFDPLASKLQTAGAGQAPADPGPGAAQAGGAGGAQNNVAPGPGPGVDTIVPDNASPNEETFKNVLRKNIPQPGWGDTITLQFQSFSLSGPMMHTVKYAGNLNQETILGGPGKQVQAYKAHTKFVQLTHYKDVNADDQTNTKEGDYWFYRDPAGHWVAEDENVQVGTTQYIHKQ